jgi:hypothetical protein
MLTAILLLTTHFSYTQENIEINPITADVKNLAVENNISDLDLEVYYRIYRGVYYWGNDFDYVNCDNFAEVFDRMRLIRDQLEPVGNEDFSKGVNKYTLKFEEEEFTSDNKNKYTDLMYYISQGLKEALNDKNRSEQ